MLTMLFPIAYAAASRKAGRRASPAAGMTAKSPCANGIPWRRKKATAIINTLTTVTFYGTDLVGNDVSASGTLQLDFGNFGDTP